MFDQMKISIASPKNPLWSYGEIKPETINYRTKPERDGLFCARLGGEDYESAFAANLRSSRASSARSAASK